MDRAAGARWIEGELLAFPDATNAWPPLDGWEGVSPAGEPTVYARVVVPVDTGGDAQPLVAAWVYASTRAPSGAVELPVDAV